MSGGKSGGTTTSIPSLSPEQNAMIAAQTGLYTMTSINVSSTCTIPT